MIFKVLISLDNDKRSMSTAKVGRGVFFRAKKSLPFNVKEEDTLNGRPGIAVKWNLYLFLQEINDVFLAGIGLYCREYTGLTQVVHLA